MLMKRLTVGILAHVDSGKTTLSEALLYTAGEILRIGRVDHKDAFLDTNNIERDRGITIFSKQAMLRFPDCEISLLDTPGHVDFSAETERTLRVLDYAILVISGTDGVQSHTETLWNLLEHYQIPTFLFINKMDLAGAEYETILSDLQTRLSEYCLDFAKQDADFWEACATADDSLLEEYMSTETVSRSALCEAIANRRLFPCFFGSALKNEGVGAFADALLEYTKVKSYPQEFGARVFKIAEDEKGQRLTYLKITGGSLRVKAQLTTSEWSQKVNEIRIYSGIKYQGVLEVFPGSVCAVTGLSKTAPGEGLGYEPNSADLTLEPVFTYSVKLPPDADIPWVLSVFRRLEEEETQLHILWNEYRQKIDVQIMGEVQLEVLKRILSERFGLEAEFEQGTIIYKETIKNTVEGVGHYEPLRHYAEVHLLLEPGKPGSGLQFKTACSEDILDKNWQRLILTHLQEKTHCGVLTGSPITDMKITLINGRAHQKHTEGGDFRQATYRAIRQGLMQAESVLLEPWYQFRLELPTENIGRAMTDLQQMGADFAPPITYGENSMLSGTVPVAKIRDYQMELTAYTRGKGRLHCALGGYAPCKTQDAVVAEFSYDPEADLSNTPDSVFCSHGSGFLVKWDKVFDYMHIEAWKPETVQPVQQQVKKAQNLIADEAELLRIFEQTYGKIKQKTPGVLRPQKEVSAYKAKPLPTGEQYLLIDGYNIIFAWDELNRIAQENLDDARILLINRICNYQAIRQNNVILVFDAYKVKGNQREIEQIHGVSIVYTKEAETADAYIEKTSRKLSRHHRVRVATSDNLVQMIIFGDGAIRIPAREFLKEVEEAEAQMRTFIQEHNRKNTDS